MKTLFTFLFSLLLLLPAFGQPQGVSMRSTNGVGRNPTLLGTSRIGTGAIATNMTLLGSTSIGSGSTLTNPTVFGTANVAGGLFQIGGAFSAAGQVSGDSFIGDGTAITDLNASELTSGTIPDARFPAVLPAVDGSQLTGISGGGSQTPWTTNINAATFYLTNAGSIYQTGATSVTLQQTVKRAAGAASHTYDALKFHYGGTNDLWWTKGFLSETNEFDSVPNSFNYVTWDGFNSPNSPSYRTNEPTFQWSTETFYVTGSQIYQGEHYMNWWANSTNKADRPVGFSLFLNGTNRPTVYQAWAMASFDYVASNGLPGLSMAQTSTNGILMTLPRDSQMSFVGNTRADGQMILGRAGQNLLGQYQYGMPTFGSRIGAASNAVVIAGGTDLDTQKSLLLFGQTNAYAGFRWNNLSNRLEYSSTEGAVALSAMTWRGFNDFSTGFKSHYISTSLTSTAGDYRNLLTVTNTAGDFSAMLQVDVDGFREDGVARYLIPITRADAIDTAWKEVIPIVNGFTNSAPWFAIDVAGIDLRAAKIRIRNLSGNTLSNIRITTSIFGPAAIIEILDTSAGGITAGGTVAGYYRNSALTQVLGKVGIGTNNPASTLFVVGATTTQGLTNGLNTSALVYADANGGYKEAAIGSGLSFDGTTLTAAGGGSGSNGVSYANYPAVNTEADYRLTLEYTNGVNAITIINDGANSTMMFTNDIGVWSADWSTLGRLRFGAFTLEEGDGTDVLTFANNQRALHDSVGDVAIDFADNDNIILGGLGLVPSLIADGQTLVRSGTSIIGAVGGSPLALTNGHSVAVVISNSFRVTGGIISTQGNNILSPLLGTILADDAPAGTYGEYTSSLVAAGSAVSLTTATAANITSISLTAGDWDVSGNINFSQGAATATATVGGISATSATLPTDGSEVNSGVIGVVITVVDGVTLPRKRINVTSTTTVYLVGKATFSAGTVTGYGSITARRMR